jgi:hypothetical protein
MNDPFDSLAQPSQGLPSSQHPTASDLSTATHQINVQHLKQIIQQDPKVNEHEKSGLLSFLNDPDALSILAGGAAGAALTNTISKFLALDRTSQILLSLAGAGIGAILIKTIGKDQSHLVNYQDGKYKVHV